jgi:predicted DNA repair protein MutK
MPSGLAALLDDVASITKMAAASIDDVGAAAMKAGSKAAGVVVDDAAVTPRYVTEFTPDRELPIIWQIAKGSLRNKLLILLPVALLLSAFLPWAVTPLLMLGGAFLCFEGAEKTIEALGGQKHGKSITGPIEDMAAFEQERISGAIRTDFILSAEIMAIALAEVSPESPAANNGGWLGLDWFLLGEQAAVLGVVALGVTVIVYGAVGLIVKMDDIGLHLAQRADAASRAVGRGLLIGMPVVMRALSIIGTAAMLWVGGQILVHGSALLGFATLEHLIHDAAHAVSGALGFAKGLIEWIVGALLAGILGLIVGAAIAAVVHKLTALRGTAH